MDTPEFKTRSEVGELVPHAGKMLLLDRGIRHDSNEVSIETEVDINESCMFYRDDRQGVPSYVAFEYMAQSISALSGVYGRTHGQKPREGFIMSVSNCKLAVTFDGAVYVGDTLAVSASLCTVEVDDPMSILKMN